LSPEVPPESARRLRYFSPSEGAKLVVADINERGGTDTVEQIRAKGGEAVFVCADISCEADARRIAEGAVSAFNKVDILVNDAVAFVIKGLEASVEDWTRLLGTNVIGTALVSRYASENMKRNGGGVIVNVSSQSAFFAQPSFASYSSTKAAILALTRCMALDLAPR
jgi:NAD(P)-dependent dehydrogenase (short-subunit alcohol dehydrogenase family)